MLARLTALAAAALCSVAVLALGAVDATATTAPGAAATVPVTITNTSIKIRPDQFTLKRDPKLARYPRGSTIHFKITNNATTPLVVTLRLLTKLHIYGANHLKTTESTKPIPPHGTAKLSANFTLRGNYELEVVKGGKILVRNPVRVF